MAAASGDAAAGRLAVSAASARWSAATATTRRPAASGRTAVPGAAVSGAAVATARTASVSPTAGRFTAAARRLPTDRLLPLRRPGRGLIVPSAAGLGKDGVGKREAQRPRDENCSLHSPLPWPNAVPGHHPIACLTPPTIEH